MKRMRSLMIAALPVILTSCQLLLGIHSERQDASVMDAGADTAADADTAPLVLWEGEPGPVGILATMDAIVFGTTRYYDPGAKLWSIPKTGGEPTPIADNVNFLAGHVSADDLIVLEPAALKRVKLDGGGTIILNATERPNRALALHDGLVYWCTRSNINSIPANADAGTAVNRIITFGVTYGSRGLVVDSTGITWGSDGVIIDDGGVPQPAEIWTSDHNGTSPLLRAGIVDNKVPGIIVTGLAKLGTMTYITVQNPAVYLPHTVWRFDGSAIAPITSAPFDLSSPTQVVARAPFIYVGESGNYGRRLGAVYRYEPATDTWTRMTEAQEPFIDVDDDYLYWSSSVDRTPESKHRALMRLPR